MAESTSVSIVGVIQQTADKKICFDVSWRTLAEARAIPSTSIIAVLLIIKSSNSIYQFVDLITLGSVYHLTTWDDVVSVAQEHYSDKSWIRCLVYSDVPRYQYYRLGEKNFIGKTSFQSNMKDRVEIFSLDHSNYVTGSYLNKKAPYVRNIKARIRTMPDVVFSKTSNYGINLENTLVSIDGNVGYPEYDAKTDELYVKNGAYFLRGTRGPDQNIVFMDFSGMLKTGSTAISKYFHECAPELFIGEDDRVVLYDGDLGAIETLLSRDVAWWRQTTTTINFTVPLTGVEYDKTVEYVPIVCFGGRLFFPGVDDIVYSQSLYVKDNVSTPHVKVKLKVDLDLLSAIVASNLQHAGIFMGNSSFYHVSIAYALSNIFTSKVQNIQFSTDEWRAIGYLCKADIPFVTILPVDKNYSFSKIEPSNKMHDGEMLFPYRSRGILISKQTKEIIDYNYKDLETTTMIETEPRKPLYLSPRGQVVAHLNRTQGPVTQIQGAADIAYFFPENATFSYSTIDGNCYVVRSIDGVIIAKSSTTTSDVPYTSANLVWTVYQTQIEIPDSMRYHDIVSEIHQRLVDGENCVTDTGINIKDNYQCFLLDMLYAGKNSKLVEELAEFHDDNQEPDIPVHTVEYESIKNPLHKERAD